jgi:hypothetical protein
MRWNERASYRTPFICLPLRFYDIVNLSIRDLKHRESVYYSLIEDAVNCRWVDDEWWWKLLATVVIKYQFLYFS